MARERDGEPTHAGAGRAVFVWPPRRNAEVELETYEVAPAPQLQAASAARAVSRAAPAPPPARDDTPRVLESIEDTWLDVIAPPLPRRMRLLEWTPDAADAYCHRCGATLGDPASSTEPCPHCPPRRLPWDCLTRLGEYRYPLTRFIHDVKFTGWARLGVDLGRLLGTIVGPEIERTPECRGRRIVVIPVPTTFRRRLARGIDHTAVIARGVAIELGADLVRALKRRHRPSQLSVAAHQRPANVAGTIRLRRFGRAFGTETAGTLLIVVDDVTTSRATLRAACLALRRAGRTNTNQNAIIWCATLAATPKMGET